MSEWKQKRFWDKVDVAPQGDGWAVQLDGRGVKTPAKAPLVAPTRAMAQEIAAEWAAQDGEIDPTAMPFTRSANAAIDKVQAQHAEVADMLAAYGDSDLLCYRADGPDGLVARQAAGWDPLLDWAAERFGARLAPRQGIMHAPQDPQALAILTARVHGFDNFELAAFHDLVALSGSLILGLAATEGRAPAPELWDLSRIDERWQEDQWGRDDEAEAQASVRQTAFLHADRFFRLSK
ncbi:MAG: ATPase [Marinibacterium sp.]|nr:ATPase [Marinibacterium sp.]